MNHIIYIVLQDEAYILSQGVAIVLNLRIATLILHLSDLIHWRTLILFAGGLLLLSRRDRSTFLFTLEDNGLVFVDPSLVLNFTFDHVITMYSSDDGAYATHIEK